MRVCVGGRLRFAHTGQFGCGQQHRRRGDDTCAPLKSVVSAAATGRGQLCLQKGVRRLALKILPDNGEHRFSLEPSGSGFGAQNTFFSARAFSADFGCHCQCLGVFAGIIILLIMFVIAAAANGEEQLARSTQ